MTDDRKDEAPAASAEERSKRAPPTIDLDASEVSGETRAARLDAVRAFMRTAAGRASTVNERMAGVASKLLAPLSVAVAALLVLGAMWAAGLIGQPQVPSPSPAVSSSRFDNVAADVDDLTVRLARVEAGAARPAVPAADPALANRTEVLEKALASVRDEASRLNAQLRTVTTSLNDLKATPRDGAASPVPDLAPLNERIERLEAATRSLASEAAKPAANAADDAAVRRLVAANTLDIAVRRGEPFASALTVAKQVAADPAALAALDPFAAKGVPSEAALLREIVATLERVTADAAKGAKRTEPQADAPRGGVLDRLQSGLAKLVRIERSDMPAAGQGGSQPAANAAVRRDSLGAARQDIAKRPIAANPQVQAWIASVDAREQALAASQKFSAEALAGFGKSGQ